LFFRFFSIFLPFELLIINVVVLWWLCGGQALRGCAAAGVVGGAG
jgi:hypothetical protein